MPLLNLWHSTVEYFVEDRFLVFSLLACYLNPIDISQQFLQGIMSVIASLLG